MAQMQKQMLVSGANTCLYFCYRSEEECINQVVNRDYAFIEKMIEAEKQFFECLMNMTPPPLTDRDYVVNENELLHSYLSKLSYFKIRKKEFEKEIDDAETWIKDFCDGKSTKCGNFKITKCVRKGAINYDSIELLKDVNLDAYRKKSVEFYRISENE